MNDLHQLSDAALAELISKSDERALKIVYDRYWAPLYVFAITILKGDLMAEDIVQDVLVDLWHRKGQFNQESTLRTYLYKAVKNRAFKEIRRKGVRDNYGEEVKTFHQNGQVLADEQVREKELNSLFSQWVDKLPPKTQIAFLKYCEAEGKLADIAGELRISLTTLKTQAATAKTKFREFFKTILSSIVFLFIICLCMLYHFSRSGGLFSQDNMIILIAITHKNHYSDVLPTIEYKSTSNEVNSVKPSSD